VTAKELRTKILERDGYTCQKCGKRGEAGLGKDDLVVHHIKRLIDGGDDSYDNLITYCVTCHINHHVPDRGKVPKTGKVLINLSDAARRQANDLIEWGWGSFNTVIHIALNSHWLEESKRRNKAAIKYGHAALDSGDLLLDMPQDVIDVAEMIVEHCKIEEGTR